MRHSAAVRHLSWSGFLILVLADAASARAAGAQGATGSRSTHSAVCATGVRTYSTIQEVPTPHDTVTLPPSPPVRVSNEEEAAAADLALRGRAGSVGATGLIITEESDNSGGGVLVRRHVVAVFVPSDSVRAHGACKT